MEKYELLADEVVIYSQKGHFVNKSKNYIESVSASMNTEIILTNLRIIIIKKKKMFSSGSDEIFIHSLGDVKLYNDIPQVKQNSTQVELFFVDQNIVIDFFNKAEAKKLVNTVLEVMTGKTKADRNAERVKGAINLVDNTLGISTVDTIKTVVTQSIPKQSSTNGHIHIPTKGGRALSGVLNIAKDIAASSVATAETKKENVEAPALKPSGTLTSEQFDSLKQLKELLEAEIISQEEFDTKKKQILGI